MSHIAENDIHFALSDGIVYQFGQCILHLRQIIFFVDLNEGEDEGFLVCDKWDVTFVVICLLIGTSPQLVIVVVGRVNTPWSRKKNQLICFGLDATKVVESQRL